MANKLSIFLAYCGSRHKGLFSPVLLKYYNLTLKKLWANLADDKLKIFFHEIKLADIFFYFSQKIGFDIS